MITTLEAQRQAGSTSFSLSVVITMTAEDTIEAEFPHIKSAISEWIGKREDQAQNLMLVITAADSQHPAILEFIKYGAAAQLAPLFQRLRQINVQLLGLDGQRRLEIPLKSSQPPPIPVVAQMPAAPPIVNRLGPEQLAALRTEYNRIIRERRWSRVLSLALGAPGLILLLIVIPQFEKSDPTVSQRNTIAALSVLSLTLIAAGLLFSAKYKGRGAMWGLSAIRSRFSRASEPDLLEAKLAQMRQTLQAHGEQV